MTKYRAFGTKLMFRAVGQSTWLEQFSIKDIEGPSISKDVIDVTTHDSAQSFIERLPGLLDGGTLSFEVEWHYDTGTGTHANIDAALRDVSGVLQEFAILPVSGTPAGTVIGYASAVANSKCWRFSGYITKVGPTFPLAGSQRANIEITVSGPVTYYPAA